MSQPEPCQRQFTGTKTGAQNNLEFQKFVLIRELIPSFAANLVLITFGAEDIFVPSPFRKYFLYLPSINYKCINTINAFLWSDDKKLEQTNISGVISTIPKYINIIFLNNATGHINFLGIFMWCTERAGTLEYRSKTKLIYRGRTCHYFVAFDNLLQFRHIQNYFLISFFLLQYLLKALGAI